MENTKKQHYTNWTYKLICENEIPAIGFDIIIKTILEAKKNGKNIRIPVSILSKGAGETIQSVFDSKRIDLDYIYYNIWGCTEKEYKKNKRKPKQKEFSVITFNFEVLKAIMEEMEIAIANKDSIKCGFEFRCFDGEKLVYKNCNISSTEFNPEEIYKHLFNCTEKQYERACELKKAGKNFEFLAHVTEDTIDELLNSSEPHYIFAIDRGLEYSTDLTKEELLLVKSDIRIKELEHQLTESKLKCETLETKLKKKGEEVRNIPEWIVEGKTLVPTFKTDMWEKFVYMSSSYQEDSLVPKILKIMQLLESDVSMEEIMEQFKDNNFNPWLIFSIINYSKKGIEFGHAFLKHFFDPDKLNYVHPMYSECMAYLESIDAENKKNIAKTLKQKN